jgi:hypothetical protein
MLKPILKLLSTLTLTNTVGFLKPVGGRWSFAHRNSFSQKFSKLLTFAKNINIKTHPPDYQRSI